MHVNNMEDLDVNLYAQAIEPHEIKRQAMLARGEVCQLGAAAILVSNLGSDGTYSPQDYERFMSAAMQFQQTHSTQYREIRIIPELTARSMRQVLRDHAVGTVAVASHGFIHGVATSDNGELYTWENAAEDTTRLKAEFFQVTCGYYPPTQKVCVPLGTFAVSDVSHVYAAPGVILPIGLKDIRPVIRSVLTEGEDLAGQLARLHEKYYRTRIKVDENGEVTQVIKRY